MEQQQQQFIQQQMERASYQESLGINLPQQRTAGPDSLLTTDKIDLSLLEMGTKLFCFGVGYTAQPLAKHLLERGWSVCGTIRNQDEVWDTELPWAIHPFLFDAENDVELDDGGLYKMKECTHLLISIPPDEDGNDPVLQYYLDDIIAMKDTLQWVGYLSSTSVYGDWEGGWVTEISPALAEEGKGGTRLQVEQQWMQLFEDHEIPVHIFRLGGIYGPGRSAYDTLLKRGPMSPNQIECSSKQWTSRVHVFDVVQTLLASMGAPDGGQIYNVVDDDPAPRAEAFAYAQTLMYAGPLEPYFPKDAFGNILDTRLNIGFVTMPEKKVDNSKIKMELDIDLEFPTYREGLYAVAMGDKRPFEGNWDPVV